MKIHKVLSGVLGMEWGTDPTGNPGSSFSPLGLELCLKKGLPITYQSAFS